MCLMGYEMIVTNSPSKFQLIVITKIKLCLNHDWKSELTIESCWRALSVLKGFCTQPTGLLLFQVEFYCGLVNIQPTLSREISWSVTSWLERVFFLERVASVSRKKIEPEHATLWAWCRAIVVGFIMCQRLRDFFMACVIDSKHLRNSNNFIPIEQPIPIE